MNVNPDIFRAYDIRGIYPDDLDEAAGYAIGRAFVTFLEVDTVIVGRDMRLSGPKMFDAVTRGESGPAKSDHTQPASPQGICHIRDALRTRPGTESGRLFGLDFNAHVYAVDQRIVDRRELGEPF